MRVNAVFQGGGVKAIGLAGAVTEAERREFLFHQVAGTSSGAIVASLLAAGYSGEEMYRIILETPFSSFLQPRWPHRLKLIGPAFRLFVRKGLYAGEALERWISGLLRAKGVRTFADLPRNRLRIIASDITQGKLLVLPDDIANYGIDPGRFTVAKAIRMSTSIPYFFDPVVVRKAVSSPGEPFRQRFVYVVDGGLLSNFPLWLFDKETNGEEKPVPTLGFQLVGRGEQKPRVILGPLTMLAALFATMMEAHDERYIEDHNRFRTIKIPTLGVQMTDFDIAPDKSKRLYESGIKSADAFFSKWSYPRYLEQYQQHHHLSGIK